MTSPRITTDLADDFATAALLDFTERLPEGTPAPQETTVDKTEAAALREIVSNHYRAEHAGLT